MSVAPAKLLRFGSRRLQEDLDGFRVTHKKVWPKEEEPSSEDFASGLINFFVN